MALKGSTMKTKLKKVETLSLADTAFKTPLELGRCGIGHPS
jgi:hypothetical protein